MAARKSRHAVTDSHPTARIAIAHEHATYVRDRIADGSRFTPGAAVDQRWTVRNSGAAPWGAGYELAFLGGDQLGETTAVPVPATGPSAEVELPLVFTAPTTPGAYRSYWKLRNPRGEWFSERLWIDIRVEAPAAPPTPGQGNKLGFYLHLSTDQHGMWEAISRVQPPVVLIHADTANTMLLEEMRRFRAPDTFVIGRLYKDVHTQRQILERDDPETQGRQMAEEILNYNFGLATKRGANGRLLIDAWMSLNEAVPGPGSDQFRQQPAATARLLNHYDRFQVAFRQRLQAAGVEAIAFNFGAGNFGTAAHYLDHFPQTLAEYVYLGFHEYGWPTLYPASDSATSAATYRPCMAGIRARYGDRHRVIITEAGLTRMYQNPAWGDVGWLNQDAPLTEDQYWQSLAWYNGQLTADDYVIGACLYEVGHHGNWATFRHLGQDNNGRPLGLVDRLVALKDSAQPRGVQPRSPVLPTPRSPLPTITIRGTVTADGKGLAGALVQLVGDEATLGTVRDAAVAMGSAVTWTRAISGFEGSVANCWRKYVAGEVAGLTYAEFKQLVGIYNGSLAATGGKFTAEQHYVLPENPHPAAIAWDRPLAGFGGSLWACWQQCVENKVIGLTYTAFKAAFADYNPQLTANGKLAAEARYTLPRNTGQREYNLSMVTGARGQFSFADLPAGEYRLDVRADGYWPFTTGFSSQDDLTIPVTLQAVTAPTTRSLGSDFIGVAGDEFVRQNRPFRFVGANIRGIVHYGDNATLPAAPAQHRMEQLQAAYDAGGRVVRIFLPSVKADVAQTVARLRDLIGMIKQNFPDLYLLPALANLYADVNLRVPGDDRFYQDNVLVKDFFTGGYRENYLPFVRQVVENFQAEPQILAWEIGNELKLDRANKGDENDPNPRHYIDFVHTVAAFIRGLDRNHLITTGMISTRHAWLFAPALKRRLYESPHLDFVTIHAYQGLNEEDDSPVARELGMPFIIEEAGFDAPNGQDRSGHIAADMNKWFGLGARGYLQWGFMATPDNGDGDRLSGMDRVFHSDWDNLVRLYRERAAALAQVDANGRPLSKKKLRGEDELPADFTGGQTVFAQDWLNVRSAAGHLGGNNVLGQIAPGTPLTITGSAVNQDRLTWYPVQTTLNGAVVNGWAAQANATGVLLATAAPRAVARGRGAATRAVATGLQQAYTQSYVNLRKDPGYVGKPGDHVIGQIDHGAPILILDGPQSADGLTWWHVRAPLPDNSSAEGWVAEVDPNGIKLIDSTPPPPPKAVLTAASGSDGMPGYLGRPFAVGSAATVVAAAANVRETPGLGAKVVATVERGTKLRMLAGPQAVDGLDWLQVDGTLADGQPINGWVAIAAAEGQRLIAPAPVAAAIQISRPFAGSWGLTQGWGSWPAFYVRFKYDYVALKGHNGLDFGTPIGTELLAVDEGTITTVDFEPGGFGNHMIITHRWGESFYAHLEQVALAVGTTVGRGTTIGLSGNTGGGTGPHLHFGIRLFPYRRADGWGGFCDPTPFMDPTLLVGARSLANQPNPMAPELPGRQRP